MDPQSEMAFSTIPDSRAIASLKSENEKLKQLQNTVTEEISKMKMAKQDASQKISEIYPELKTKLPNKRKPWEPENYYQGIFDALALVLTHQYLND